MKRVLIVLLSLSFFFIFVMYSNLFADTRGTVAPYDENQASNLKSQSQLPTVTGKLPGAKAKSADFVTIPNGTITASGEDGYDYIISSGSINAQACSEVHVTGKITAGTFPNVNAGWLCLGLITKYERDRALTTYGVASFMFNHAVFMMLFKPGANPLAVQSGDYAGDFAGGLGTAHTSLTPPFTFDLKLVPNVGDSGGVAYLSIDGGSYDAVGLTYGKDNWNNYGWSEPKEELSEAYLIAQLYTWDAGQTYSVSFEEVRAFTPGCPPAPPVPAFTSYGYVAVPVLVILIGVGALLYRRRKTIHSS